MSKGFVFRLQKVLDIREEKEEESKRFFRESQKALNEAKIELSNMESNASKYKGIKPNEDVVYQKIKRTYLKALELGIKEKKREVIDKKEEVEYRRNDLLNKQIDRKTVEKLKEKEREAFFKEIDRVEQINNDEFALYAYMRNLKGGEI